jgi:hypothetical protein
VPKQNRPLVRDGRLQARKKRTDRSYLRPAGAPPPLEDQVAPEEIEAPADSGPEAVAEPLGAPPPAPARAATAAAPARLPSTARALQQQGVRKRRELDIAAVTRRDSEYALHEMRRIFTLAAMVVVTLIILGIVLR